MARRRDTLVRAAALVPPATIAVLVARHARNVPWKDQWGAVPLMAAASRGELPAGALWDQVNEHRIPLSLALQAGLAWATRWDVRAEAWLNVALAGATLLALAALVRRTVGVHAPAAAPWTLLACSLVVFSPAGGINWPWGAMNPAFLAALAAATVAWRLAVWRGTWSGTLALVAGALAGAGAFGAGVVLLLVVPAALLATPGVPFGRRAVHAAATLGVAAAALALYFHGWHARPGEPPLVFHWTRLGEYAFYVVTYVGGGIGTATVPIGFVAGLLMIAVLVGATAWLRRHALAVRPALVPWWALAAYGVANAALTAFGRLDNGMSTSLFVRYLPTASCVVLGAIGVVALGLPRAGRTARIAVATAVAAALPVAGVGYARGVDTMAHLAAQLDIGARCLPACTTASDLCLLYMCWDADVARRMCPIMAEARIGPFAP